MTSMPLRTVLVVDDEPLILWSVSERLRAEGYDVLEAGTGRAAIQHCEKPVDLVLLDLGLPDLEGLSVLKHLLKVRPDLPVILMTADPAMEGAAEALQLRSFPRANKPFLLDDLVGLVHGSIGAGSFSHDPENLRTV